LKVRNGKIVDALSVFFDERRRADIQVDCDGLILSPGFIDIQINGGFGVDFSSLTSSDEEYEQGVQLVSRKLLQYGVTSFAPTIISSAPEVYSRVLPLLARRNGSAEGTGLLGAHVEGPFISLDKRGCHPRQHVRDFGDDAVRSIEEVYGSTKNIAIVTLAPELQGSGSAIKYFCERGIIVSLGHSSAGMKDGERAVNLGAKCITHLFNAMQGYHHRDPFLIGLLTSKIMEACAIYYGIISDGVHTHDSALRIAHRTNPDGLILITDAIAALGMGDGRHKLGDCIINVTHLNAVLEGTNTVAGSVASMPHCIAHLVKAVRCPLEEALVCATEKPATLLGIQARKGVISLNADADFVLISKDVDVHATFVSGKLAYAKRSQ
uniref:N-acetylglucosamine-6-phosphate deacetylase n=1 Tax=Angiostrongylus costaricensis TaxID=334426 RepID=A0A0R3Q067_ANGCS